MGGPLMRYLLGIVLTLAIVAPTVPRAQQATFAGMWINLSNTVGKGSVGVGLQRTEMYLGGPSAAVPAQALSQGSKMNVSSFSIRAWKEGDQARVLIAAVMLDN